MKQKKNNGFTRLSRRSTVLAVVAGLGAALLGLAPSAHANDVEAKHFGYFKNRRVVTVDVAEDFAKFVPGPPFDDDGVPERGSFFVTEGNIYPKGTIKGDGADFDPNADGAVGTWFCRGTHLVSGTEFPNARFAVDTAQAYLLPSDKDMIVTDGLEGGLGFEIQRAVSGGTGKFKNYIGIQKQELLGFNKSGGVNLRVTFVLRRAAR